MRELGYDANRLTCRKASNFASAPPVSIERAAIPAAPSRLFAAPVTNSAAAALINTRSRASSLRRPSRTSRMIAAFSSADPPRKWSIDAGRSPKSAGEISKRSTPSGDAEWTTVLPASVISSNPSSPRTTHARRVFKRASARATFSQAASDETPATWNGAPAGLVSGPSKLKIVHAQVAAHHRHTLRRGVVQRREHEADADLVEDFVDAFRRQIDLDAERAERVGAPGPGRHPDVAVFGHGHARRRDHEGGGGRDVERFRAAAARAAGVDVTRMLRRDPRAARAHRLSEPGQLLLGLALARQRDQGGGDARIGRVVGQNRFEQRGGFRLSQVLPRDQLIEKFGEHSFRKLPSNRLPATVIIDSG